MCHVYDYRTVAGINKTYDTYPVDRITMPADLSVIEPVPVKALVKKHGSPVKKERFLPPDGMPLLEPIRYIL